MAEDSSDVAEDPSPVEKISATAIDTFESIQRYLALFFLIVGLGMLIIGIIAASTEWFTQTFEMSVYEAWRVAGIFAGLGLPMIMVGIFTVLPATNKQRLGAGVGLALVVAGVILFAMNFPNQWYGDETDRTFLVVSTYFAGAMLTLFYLFLSVANFQTPMPSTPEMPSAPSYPQISEDSEGDEEAMAEEMAEQHAQQAEAAAMQQNQNPQTAAALLKSILGLLFDTRNDPKKQEIDDVDLEEIMEEIKDLYDEDAIDSIQEVDNHIVIKRTETIRDNEFKRNLPQYVDLVDQDGKRYALKADNATFYFLVKYEHE